MTVYFARIGGPKGPIKIGYSVNPVGRMKGLAVKFQKDVTLLATLDDKHDISLEQKLHERFEASRVFLEFELFHETEELMALIRSCAPVKENTKATYRTKAQARAHAREKTRIRHIERDK